jgi:hypothetical protein
MMRTRPPDRRRFLDTPISRSDASLYRRIR